MLIVMVISIIFFIFIRVESPILRVVFRVALVPVIAGVSYEFIRFAGNSNNIIIRILSLPGMWLQALTTKEPDDGMIEVAIAAVEAVFDWRAYQGRSEEEPSMEEAVPSEETAEQIEEPEETAETEEAVRSEDVPPIEVPAQEESREPKEAEPKEDFDKDLEEIRDIEDILEAEK